MTVSLVASFPSGLSACSARIIEKMSELAAIADYSVVAELRFPVLFLNA